MIEAKVPDSAHSFPQILDAPLQFSIVPPLSVHETVAYVTELSGQLRDSRYSAAFHLSPSLIHGDAATVFDRYCSISSTNESPSFTAFIHWIYLYSAPETGAEYCDQRVCLSLSVCVYVCLSAIIIFGTTRPIFTKCFLHVAYGRGSVLF